MIHGREKPTANSTTENSEANERNYQTQKEEDLAQKFQALYGKKKKIRIHGGSGLSVEFGSGVGLRRWLFFRTVELLKGKTINYIFFF
jgi:hypothetical protein